MGVAAYVSDMLISAEDIAKMEPDMKELYMNNSLIQKVVYGLGVIGGFIGSVGLLLRKPWAILFFLISLIGVIIQFVYGLAFTNAFEILGATSLILPAVIVLAASFLFWYSRRSKAQGLI